MYLTREDLEKIRKYIAQTGVKDSQFPEQEDLYGDEWITIVDSSGNKKMRMSTLIRLLRIHSGDYTGEGIQEVPNLESLETIADKKHGNLVYVFSEDSYYSYSRAEEWQQILKLYIGDEEPKDPSVLWLDLDESIIDASSDDNFANLLKSVADLISRVNQLEKLTSIGIIPGDTSNSYRSMIMSVATPENPNTGELEEEEEPDKSEVECTVPHNCIKSDTSSNFFNHKQDLVDGEILFYTDKKRLAVYYQGKFYTINSNNSGGEGGEGSLTVEDLYTLALDYLIFNGGDSKYKIRLNDRGNWAISKYDSNVTLPGSPSASWGNYISHLLCINSVFCGGEGSEEALCSHNYIELANGSKNDINLKGLYLLYTDNTKESADDIGYIWKVLPLDGVIKAGSTFLIRGAQVNNPKTCLINVESYDLEWFDNDKLITFNQSPSSFYLCAGDSFKELLDNKTLNNPWAKAETKVGYIDSCGFGSGSVGEGSTTFLVESDWNKTLFVRWFMLEPAKQGNKAYASRKTTDLWTYIDLEKQTVKEGNSIQYYYSDYIKQKYTPKASHQNKNFFTIKTDFDSTKPNMINITFGIQATDNGTGATRCFNWVSVGYFDEFIEYRKVEETVWNRKYSYIDKDSSNPDYIQQFISHYKRLRWCTSSGVWVTSHKVIIKGLEAGEYEYRVGRDNDSSYISDTLNFSVVRNSDVSNFSFIHTSDQQGFNWAEYTAWKKAAYMINKTESDFNFIINTGDITQSGNRPSEWLDYYEGKKYLLDKEEMFTIGNNDLCGHNSSELTDGEDATSKYNHINVLRYYTFELDTNNVYEFEWGGEKYPIYSVYSFNYGDYHFVSLNSEIAVASSKMYKDWQSDTYAGDRTFAEAANAHLENWFLKDLQIWTGQEDPQDCSKCIVYCHEMPFTIVTWGFMSGSSARAGSKLNTLNSNGEYRFSRIFKERGIRLVMGGHKHTYCITKPIYDAPENYVVNGLVNSSVNIMGPVDVALSRIPVIQVTKEDAIETNAFARYELVEKITAPTYVMSQASGYKLVSNKEQPSGDAYTIPWLLAYFKAKNNAASPTENVAQHRPMYIKYDLSSDEIKVTAIQVHNIWNVNIDKNSKSFNMNNQLSDLYTEKMTLSTTSESDMSNYDITNRESYIIKL